MLQDEKDKIEPYMTVEDVCKYFSSTKETVYRWIKKNDIPAHRIGKRWMFRRSAIDEWVKSGKAAE